MLTDPNANVEFIVPSALILLCLASLFLLIAPRRWCLASILTVACFVTLGQRIVILGLDFTLLRVLIAVGFLRIFLQQWHREVEWGTLDKLVLWWLIVRTVCFTLSHGTFSALINRLGDAMDFGGMYFILRCTLRERSDAVTTLKTLAFVVVPVALAMSVEYQTGRNLFFFFGGVPAYTTVRDGVIRCQGVFAHPILAGTFAGTGVPLMVAVIRMGGAGVILGSLGFLALVTIVFYSGSTGPLLCLFAGIAVLFGWMFRHKMKMVFGMAATAVFALSMAMSDPIWYLPARLNVRGGSTGWHRAHLVDEAIRHFWQWFLVGTQSIAGWGVWANDITSQYIGEAVRGGLASLVLFCSILIYGSKELLKAVKRNDLEGRVRVAKWQWAIGAAVVAHAAAMYGVGYFDQTKIFLILAIGLMATEIEGERIEARSDSEVTEKASAWSRSAAGGLIGEPPAEARESLEHSGSFSEQ